MKQSNQTRVKQLERQQAINGDPAKLAAFYAMCEEEKRQYNSPQAEAERRAFYTEVLRISELRRQAEIEGKPLSTYPLPWE